LNGRDGTQIVEKAGCTGVAELSAPGALALDAVRQQADSAPLYRLVVDLELRSGWAILGSNQ
jgi:hypothetical protein